VRYYWTHCAEDVERVMRRLRARSKWCGDLHHRDPATKSFSLLADKSLLNNREVLLAEIANCDVEYANCHAVRTWLT